MKDDEAAVTRGLHVELDVLGSHCDRALERGEAKLVFDLETETIGLMTPAQYERARRDEAAIEREGNE